MSAQPYIDVLSRNGTISLSGNIVDVRVSELIN
jgi:hypothetical protein